jgi:hypothetical protein
MSAALTRGWRKAARTLLQLAAGGGLTALVDLAAHGLSPASAGAILVAWGTVVAFLHNYLETNGSVPVLLPTPGLVPSVAPVLAPVVGTVETAIDQVGGAVGDVTGVVTDLTGGLLGEVNPPGEGGT